mgnify:CR=1 FL=1
MDKDASSTTRTAPLPWISVRDNSRRPIHSNRGGAAHISRTRPDLFHSGTFFRIPLPLNEEILERIKNISHTDDTGGTDCRKRSQKPRLHRLSQHDHGRELKVVTAIMKLKMVPSWAPLAKSASATGMVPKISAYMGTPTRTARTTPKGFPLPRAVSIQPQGSSCGSQPRSPRLRGYMEIPSGRWTPPVPWHRPAGPGP